MIKVVLFIAVVALSIFAFQQQRDLQRHDEELAGARKTIEDLNVSLRAAQRRPTGPVMPGQTSRLNTEPPVSTLGQYRSPLDPPAGGGNGGRPRH